MQFVVTARDYTDAEALQRRLANREQHLAGVRAMVAEGSFLSGGAILDDSGKMTGSSLHLQFPDRVQLEARLQQDPYIRGRVWEHVEILEVKLVALS